MSKTVRYVNVLKRIITNHIKNQINFLYHLNHEKK